MKPGDIYFVSLEPTVGHEQRGTRPVFVLTTEKFNRLTATAIVAAITSGGQFARRNGLTVELPPSTMKTHGAVRCDQLRTLDLPARGARYVETADDATIDEVLDHVAALFDRP